MKREFDKNSRFIDEWFDSQSSKQKDLLLFWEKRFRAVCRSIRRGESEIVITKNDKKKLNIDRRKLEKYLENNGLFKNEVEKKYIELFVEGLNLGLKVEEIVYIDFEYFSLEDFKFTELE